MIFHKHTWPLLLLVGVMLILLAVFFHYPEIFFLRPQSVHCSSQCDRASIALNYYKDNRGFFSPAVHYIGIDRTGQAVSEFPLIQYAVAQLYKIGGFHEWIYRGVVFLFAFFGLIFLFKISRAFIGNIFFPVVVVVVVFTSPVFAYYGNNFLPDVPALSFVFAGWYFFFRFCNQKKRRDLILFNVLFVAAALIKVSAGINFVAVFFLYLFDARFSEQGKDLKRKGQKSQFLFFVIGSLVICGWYFFAIRYNELHKNSGIFLTRALPVWSYSAFERGIVLEDISRNSLDEFLNKPLMVLCVICFFLNIIFWKKINAQLLRINILSFLGCLCIVVLWFGNLRFHDYYFVQLLIFPVFTLIAFFEWFSRIKFNRVLKGAMFTAFPALLLYSIAFAEAKNRMKYFPERKKIYDTLLLNDKFIERSAASYRDDFKIHNSLKGSEILLRSLGISRDDRVVAFPDESLNVSLYLMDQKGFPMHRSNLVSDGLIDFLIRDAGFKYMVITDTTMKNDPAIQPYTHKSLATFGSMEIFDLRKQE